MYCCFILIYDDALEWLFIMMQFAIWWHLCIWLRFDTIHLFTLLIDKNLYNFVLVKFWLLQLDKKPNQNYQLVGGQSFLLGGSISISIIRKLNFEKKWKNQTDRFQLTEREMGEGRRRDSFFLLVCSSLRLASMNKPLHNMLNNDFNSLWP
jgi:hypothetical protein